MQKVELICKHVTAPMPVLIKKLRACLKIIPAAVGCGFPFVPGLCLGATGYGLLVKSSFTRSLEAPSKWVLSTPVGLLKIEGFVMRQGFFSIKKPPKGG